jgi:O-antigen ligase
VTPLQNTRPAPIAAVRKPFFPQFAPVQVSVFSDAPGISHWILGSYALMLTVPIAEILIVFGHVHIPVVVIADFILTILVIASGRVAKFLQTPMAKPWLGTLFLYVVAAAFGVYKGESVPFILEYGVRFHVVPLYCCAIAVSTLQVRHVLRWIGWGSLLLVVLCAVFGESREGRFLLPDTSLQNPNDLAFAFLFIVVCLLLNSSKISRVIAWLTVPMIIVYVLKTGSRASLVTIFAVIATAFILSRRSIKLLILVALPICAALVVAVVPSYTLQRLTLIVANTDDVAVEGQLKHAVDSQEARTALQMQAIRLALHHPLFGVGANQFANAVDDMVREETGEKSGWQGAHNTYLEVAAENGIPAMILYMWTLFLCARVNLQTYRRCQRDPLLAHAAAQSMAMVLMTVAFVVCVAFSNNAYDPRVGILVGLSAANYLAVKSELERRAPAAKPVAVLRNSKVLPNRIPGPLRPQQVR